MWTVKICASVLEPETYKGKVVNFYYVLLYVSNKQEINHNLPFIFVIYDLYVLEKIVVVVGGKGFREVLN